MGELCRCHLPLEPPGGIHWWPRRDAEPETGVRAVALYGQDPGFLRRERVAGGWHTEGAGAAYPESTPPGPWARAGRCWAQVDHPVVDVSVFLAWTEGSRAELGAAAPVRQDTR